MLLWGILTSALFSLFLLCFLQGTYSVNVITLGSIEIFNAHEWLPSNPTVYFHCQGEEKKTFLPDVKKTHILYTFKGVESWQPLTELPEEKCKRCGVYEQDTFQPDDIFDEWELCPADFLDGKYFRFKENEFNATFLCSNCTASTEQSQNNASKHDKGKVGYIIIMCSFVFMVLAVGMVAAYRYRQKQKRNQDQVRFLKLFDEGDDIEDELGFDPVL